MEQRWASLLSRECVTIYNTRQKCFNLTEQKRLQPCDLTTAREWVELRSTHKCDLFFYASAVFGGLFLFSWETVCSKYDFPDRIKTHLIKIKSWYTNSWSYQSWDNYKCFEKCLSTNRYGVEIDCKQQWWCSN